MLREKIDQDLKQAMMDKNELVLSVLRMLKGAVRNKEISLRSGNDVSLDDDQMIEVIKSEVKKRQDSAAAYEQGNRDDLKDKELGEAELLKKYLPEQMSDEELENIIKDAVAKADPETIKNFGKMMGAVMPLVKGKADGGRISVVLKKFIA